MLLRPMQCIVFKFIWISADSESIENDTKTITSVDGKHFIRFRGKNSVFKFIRISVDGALEQGQVMVAINSRK